MRFILLTLFTLVNCYLPKHRTLIILNNRCFNQNNEKYKSLIYQEKNYLKKRIRKLEIIKNKIIGLANDNLKYIKEIIEDDHSTEWDFYNETWKLTK